jgi:signal peptidase II
MVVAVDQATKFWAESALTRGERVALIGDLLGLRLTYNPGAAFSIGTQFTWLLTLIAAAAVVVISIAIRRVGVRAWAVSLALVLGGAITHLLDRLLRAPGPARGQVVDFIDYGLFVGNVADIALVIGVSLAVLLHLRGVPLAGRAGQPDEPSGGGPGAPPGPAGPAD